MLLVSSAVWATWLSTVYAASAYHKHVLHERREASTSAWQQAERVHGDVVLPMRIGLIQSNIDKGPDMLMEVSQPDSPKYGQYYTAEQVRDFFAPSNESVEAVRSWLVSAGIPRSSISQSANKQWIQFDAKTAKVESIFNAKYHVYEHKATGHTNVACNEYHVPNHVQEHIDYITPGIKLTTNSGILGPDRRRVKKRRSRRDDGNSTASPPPSSPLPPQGLQSIISNPLDYCDLAVTPLCVRALYNMSRGTLSTSNNQLGIFETLGDVYSQTDLDLFFSNFFTDIPNGTHPILNSIDGGVAPIAPGYAGTESTLDLQLSIPIVWPQSTIVYQTDDPVYQQNYVFIGFLNNFFDAIDGSYCTYSAYGETGNSPYDPPYPDPYPGGYKGSLMCGTYRPTNVIAISYGGQEGDLPIYYQRRQCSEVMKLGLQGISVIVATGDFGVSGPPGDDNENGCLGTRATIFSPSFPVNCPWVTSVGSTFLPEGANVFDNSEVATTTFPSGGGFSNIYNLSEASYQQAAVESFFTKNTITYPSYNATNGQGIKGSNGIYNRIGRGMPDISAVGDNILVVYNGAPTLLGGSSASAPIFASILTRINEERISRGKSTVGFVNPVLYAHTEAFNDVKVGSNPGCFTSGFSAVEGWDPVTGLGTPRYDVLLQLYMNMD